ncbi:CTP synthase [Saccharomycopsis crataegensis]|uniref:CTP synthase n=1 Tax=Saccharomycopsis crataegensis TaxID=43959 RepID=A0AAV5QSI7_9ASCO|nr:CTP synthase [Saccharomycopsis crataegensis]
MKYVFVSGGVISGIGKGILASSTGLLLKTLGYRVTSIKIDPYMNIDAGTMSPLEHGEVFTLDDGAECDLDLGNYERYLNISLTRDHNITTGKVYQKVLEKERRGDYLGKTVQIVPHLTNEIQDWIERTARIPVDNSGEEPDICIVELGGTVGDIESAPFIEAVRQFQFRVGSENFALVHVCLVPVINGEQKTKPTQAAIKDLRSLGLTPDLIACRCPKELEPTTMSKISMFCHVGPDHVLGVHDLNSTYHVPLLLKEQKLDEFLVKKFGLGDSNLSQERITKGEDLLKRWSDLCSSVEKSLEVVNIAVVGKYTNLHDSYLSVIKSLEHSSMKIGRKMNITWIESTDLEKGVASEEVYNENWAKLKAADGVLVPGGFGSRGIEGMIAAANYARTNKVPYLGVCLGLQVAVIEFVRNILGIEGATSQEFDESTPEDKRAIVYMPEIDKNKLGGTMRLGLRSTKFQPNSEWSKIRQLYGGKPEVFERHRHRYEVNPKLVSEIENHGLSFVGKDENHLRMEIFELKDESHPYYVAAQYHPEYLSKVLEPSRPFLGLVAAAAGVLDKLLADEQLNSGSKADF